MKRGYRCKLCGKQINPNLANWQRKRKKYCSPECTKIAASQRMKNNPSGWAGMHSKKSREKARIGIKIGWEKMEPEIKKRMALEASQRMLKNNPSHNPKNIEKAKSTKRLNGTLHIWKGKRGGNGSLTAPQQLLACALGWPMEVTVKTTPTIVPEGRRRNYLKKKNLPTCYKIDVANPELKIGIEVDGDGHKSKENTLIDQKKTKILRQKGWKILRFTNQEIMNNISKVLVEVKKEFLAF